VVRAEKEGKGHSVWYYRRGRLCAVDAMNSPRSYLLGKRMIEAGISPPAESVADASTDLKALALTLESQN